MKANCPVCKLVGALVIIGALNWGLVGILQFNLVTRLLGDMTTASRAVYSLIGVAGVIKLLAALKGCPACAKS